MSGSRRAPRLRLAGALSLSSSRGLRRSVGRLLLVTLLVTLLGKLLVAQAQHVVEPGDTLYSLAARYGTTVEALRLENGLADSLLRVGQRLELPSRAGFRFEPALAGETLPQLASRLDLSLQTLQLANPAVSGSIAAGARIRVPPGEGLSVLLEEGDSVLGLAIRHGVAPSAVLEANDLEQLSEVGPGDWLYLPVESVGRDAAGLPQTAATGGPAELPPAPPAELPPVEVPPAEWHAREQAELLARAPLLIGEFVPTSSVFLMPLEGRLSSSYGWRNISVAGNRFHGGIDLAVDLGTPVAAAMDGIVVRAGWVGAYGYAVYIDHGEGLQTRYAHLSELLVAVGSRVRQGDIIARAGSSGASTGPHLHFEIRMEGQAVDPLSLLER